MNKHTAESRQYLRREGSYSTRGTARGTNLLGWEEVEQLSPEQERKAMAARVGQINEIFRTNKQLPKWQREQLTGELIGLVESMRAIRPSRKPGYEINQHFIDVARSRLTKAEFDIWMGEANRRLNVALLAPAPAANKDAVAAAQEGASHG